ncbi:hypothetical protein [Acidocella aminolytica]|nr:hypothetical protein [Acidocella aminolytica]
MSPDFPIVDYYGGSASMVDIGANSLGIPSKLPSGIKLYDNGRRIFFNRD